jgi:hypothetical protein
MLWMLLIGWIVLLPGIVVGGLYVSSSVLGRRCRAAMHTYEELFADEGSSEPTHELWAGEAGRVMHARPAPVPANGGMQAPPDAAATDRPRVAAADRPQVAARY